MIRKLTVLFLSSLMCLAIGTLIPAMAYQEAPMLRVKVAEGELPPVEERLPENPLVLKPIKEIGQYGGTWNKLSDGGDTYRYQITVVNEGIVCWDYNQQVVPNIAESWEFSSDSKELTLFLRKGIKWSDGVPFTADDIMFWYEDVILNKDLYPTTPSWLVMEGEVGKFTKLDDYTVKLSFAKPYGLLLENLARGMREIFAPKHYLKQFHPKYTSLEKVNKLAKDAGLPAWSQLFMKKNNLTIDPKRPVMKAWQIDRSYLGAERVTAERNPYYWKVDPAGNQLPYIDKVVLDLVTSPDVEILKLLSGEVDLAMYGVSLKDYTLYKEAEREGKIRLFEWENFAVGEALVFNQNHKDPVLRKIFQNVKFRQAVSLALNRDEVNEVRYMGLAENRQFTLPPASPYYLEGADKSYIEYNPERVNELLDEIGLSARDKEGFRLRPDGKTLSIIMDITIGRESEAELVKIYLEAVGIKTSIALRERTFYHVRKDAAEHDLIINGMSGSPLLLAPWFFIPLSAGSSEGWGPLWGVWIETDGQKGERPPEDVLGLVELYQQLQTSVDPKERASLGKEIMRLHQKNLWIIGINGMGLKIFVAAPNLRNFPEKGTYCSDFNYYAWTHPEQYFFEQK